MVASVILGQRSEMCLYEPILQSFLCIIIRLKTTGTTENEKTMHPMPWNG